jgi:carnitine O-acetyltransferase
MARNNQSDFHTCDGDYRKDAGIQDSGALYEAQQSLPRLPVPALHATLDKYLESIKPLTSPKEFEKTAAIVARFGSDAGDGPELQRELLARAAERSQSSSWLAEWWNKHAYLLPRDPIVINVSYFYGFRDLPLPQSARERQQIVRAASLLHAALDFRYRWLSGSHEPERVGKDGQPLCSVAYRYMFNSCRIPGQKEDSVRLYPATSHHDVAVLIRGNFYMLSATTDWGEPLPAATIEAQLSAIAGSKALTQSIGMLTTLPRSKWGEARAQLLLDGNHDSLTRLEAASMLLCLDDAAPVSLDESSAQLWHGNARVRFFDKPVQLVVFSNGKAGLVCEHSMSDGTPMLRLADHLLRSEKRIGEHSRGRTDPGSALVLHPPEPLLFRLSTASCRWIAEAEKEFLQMVADHDIRNATFTAYGADEIKRAGGFGPDAFFQAALQLAYFRVAGKLVPTYEPAQVRRFLHGRTAVIRSVTAESLAWVQAMEGPRSSKLTVSEKIRALRAATAKHSELAKEASAGRDCDRHLFGLSLIAQGRGGSNSQIFKDPVYAATRRWAISTSHLVHDDLESWGWGEVVPDGIGLPYSVKKRSIYFSVAARRNSHMPEWPARMCHVMQETLLEMRDLWEADAETKLRSSL